MIHNRSICICPKHKGGARCLIKFSCEDDLTLCLNGGKCLVLDDGLNDLGFICICPEEFTGHFCEIENPKLEISFRNIEVSSTILIYFFGSSERFSNMDFFVSPQKLTMFQRTLSLYTKIDIKLAFVKIVDRYYLAVHQKSDDSNISTSMGPNQRCKSINELLNPQSRIRQVKYYHVTCQKHTSLICFFDEVFMCLCTIERRANCFKFNPNITKCPYDYPCENDGQCLNLGSFCTLFPICNCIDCYFGDKCQFYAKSIGLTLDDVLRYDIQQNVTMNNQNNLVKWSSVFIMILFVASLISSILSIITFRRYESREVECGLYLLASSITSFLTIIILTCKYWFIILTQINPIVNYSILRAGCISLEFLLKLCLYMDNCLNTCVALERSMTVYKGMLFNKSLSKIIARWVIIFLPVFVAASIIHEPLYRQIYDDKHEQRLWCVFNYSRSLYIYNRIISFFYVLAPFCANLFSALYIIFNITHRRAITQKRQTYKEHLRQQFREHKNLLISPIILIILMIPRILISFLSECLKTSDNSWLYFMGYIISFLPSVAIFFIFIIPSDFYREQFKKAIKFRQ